MTSNRTYYHRKSFSRQEWRDYVMDSGLPFDIKTSTRDRYGGASASKRLCVEPSIPVLLLNYFVVMSYEEASIRMARELGYVKNNKDAAEFNKVYKIGERAHIRQLIKKGKILEAINEINTKFGVEVLEQRSDEPGKAEANDDLHFKLLLLNLIEMIRNHHQGRSSSTLPSEETSNQFILELIQYSQDKLALKAGSNKRHMKELELVMTLLLFPMELTSSDEGQASADLPKSLKNLYLLSLRAKIANLVNKKLLEAIRPNILLACNEGKFPDLIGFKSSQANFANYHGLLRARSKDSISSEAFAKKLEDRNFTQSDNSRDKQSIRDSWRETTMLLENQEKKALDATSSVTDNNLEARLIKVMKLWAYCENQLHYADIGVPRVEGGI
ncbi:LAMI_0G16380g1_1 [Lachancea mirantina]|uniref:LAMI_0G16380g1_1 n=1 Tax=Lachancea mirantina TaxID=1230905 RepID=A0A1G4KCK1_9SACH|nr:LAMI_0G16380g1_1 [Lachancea mirantina]